MKLLRGGKSPQHATQCKVRSKVLTTPKTLAVTVAVATALVAQLSVVSNASWTDQEWNHAATLGTQDCLDPEGPFASRGQGRALSGSLLGIDLDNIVAANGVKVTQRDAETTVFPNGANPAPQSPAFADPLNVGLLGNAIKLDLGNGMLQLPLNNDTGVLGQFGAAYPSGLAQGAAGYITESGAIGTEPGSGYPELATLKLSDLIDSIDPGIAQTLGDVSDIALEVGAVTGRATLDGCDATWHGVTPVQRTSTGEVESGNLEREYLTSAADLVVTTPALSGLTGALEDTVITLENTVNALASDQGVLDSLLGAVNGLLGTLISDVLRLGEVSATLTATVDTTALRQELFRTTPLADSAGVVSIDLVNNEIRVNTVGLLQEAYPGQYGQGLNGLPPNTNLLADERILNTLVNTVTTVLADWLNVVNTLLNAAVDAVQVSVVVLIKLKVNAILGDISIGSVTAQVNGKLVDLLSGSFKAAVTTDLNLGLVGLVLKPVVEALVNTLIAGLVNNLGLTVGTVLNNVLGPLRTVTTAVTDAVQLVVTTVSNFYSGLLLGGPSLAPILAVTVNAQNAPFTGSPEPSDWVATAAHGIPTGQYDVAALRISVLEGLAGGVVLYLGRGSVGPGCSPSSAHTVGCADY